MKGSTMENLKHLKILEAIEELEGAVRARDKLNTVRLCEAAMWDDEKLAAEQVVCTASHSLYSTYIDVELWSGTDPETRGMVRAALMAAADCTIDENCRASARRFRDDFNQFIWRKQLDVAASIAVPAAA